MAYSDLLVTISGAALSLLFYENVRSCGDQMGFLLGDTLEFVVKTYSDSENQIETVKTHNHIETIVTCPLPEILHDSIGRVNKEKLTEFLAGKSKQVIGWFRFRRNTGLVPTMRDKMLHREFASYFSGGNGSKEEFFVTCLLSSAVSNGRGTHKYRHVFLRRRKGTFEPVSLRINNLGNDSFKHDGSDYKLTPSKRSSSTPDVFTKLIKSLDCDLSRTSGFESANCIQKAGEQHLNLLIPQLCKSDLEVAELERQVKEFKLNRMAKMNGSANNVDNNSEVEKECVDEEIQKLKISQSDIESPDHVFDDKRTSRDLSATTSQSNTVCKPKSSERMPTYAEKTNNQIKSKRTNVDAVYNSSKEPPHVKNVSEVKVNITDALSSRNRRFSNIESEIVKESICKGETHESGVGRGRGKLIHNSYLVSKKIEKVPGTMSTRINSERTSHSQMSNQESSEIDYVQNTSAQVSNSQSMKKKVDIHKSNSTDTH